MRRNGYDSYHGRSRVRTFLKVLIVLLLVVLAVAVGALLWLEPYIDYSANGIKINLPFFQQKEPAPATGAPVVVTTPEPTPTPEPEEDFRGILLPNSALYDGTAAQQVEAAGATAALFDMKADDGSLGYTSRILRQEFPYLKTKMPTLWTNSYFISTVGGAPMEAVKQYIENQKTSQRQKDKMG